jgi:antitoxin CcdA
MKPRIKKSVNLSIRNDLIIKSKAYGVNLSHALEEKLIQILKEKEENTWLAENREAIKSYNSRVEKEGVFSDKLRTF